MSSPTNTVNSPFLALPLELRLQIFEHVFEDSKPAVTFSTAVLTGSYAEIVNRLYGEGRSPWDVLPSYHIPAVEPRFSRSLLSVRRTACEPATYKPRPEEHGKCSYNPTPSLLLVNKQIRTEALKTISREQRHKLKRFSLFMSYPCGIHVFTSIAQHLMPQIHTIQITGQYTSTSFDAIAVARTSEADAKAVEATKRLSHLISVLLGPAPTVAQLQLRIFYPGPGSQNRVWGDDHSPIVVAMRNIFAGELQVELWRGKEGTGVVLSARPSKDGLRSVHTHWKKLEAHHCADIDKWLIDPDWPRIRWQEDETTREDDATNNVLMSLTGDSPHVTWQTQMS